MPDTGRITLQMTPEMKEAVEYLAPVAHAAVAYVEYIENDELGSMEPYNRLAEAVRRYKQYQRDTRPIKVVK